jgi:hypothetical protein
MSLASETPVLDCRRKRANFSSRRPLPRILHGSSLPPEGVDDSLNVTSLGSPE